MDQLMSLVGMFALVGIAWGLSEDRRSFPTRVVGWGFAWLIGVGLLVLSPSAQEFFFVYVDAGVRRLLSFSEAGADFAFQTVEPHQVADPSGKLQFYAGHISPPLKSFAFWILPSIIFFSSLMSVSYHIGLMQWVVRGMALVMQRTMGTSGAETLACAANIFLGQTEAPLLVKPFIATMTRSELLCIMLGGFANTAGGVLAAYVSFLRDIPGIAGHLVTCSILSAPATMIISKVMIPEKEKPVTGGSLEMPDERPDRNLMEAAARGASEGMTLAINVAAMLIAFVALMAMIDWFLGLTPVNICGSSPRFGWEILEGCKPISLSYLLGLGFTPLAFLMGVPWAEANIVGTLLGEKLVLTEFIAYIHLGQLQASATPLSERSALIASYALCGFANFASVGIQLGGIGGMAPNRMGELAELALKAMIGGSLATFLCACVAGLLL
jgi:CNT family concentrative nucleoside transporter